MRSGLLAWGGKLLALFEAGQPHALNPKTLETLGLDDLGGLLRPGAPFSCGSSALDGFFGAALTCVCLVD